LAIGFHGNTLRKLKKGTTPDRVNTNRPLNLGTARHDGAIACCRIDLHYGAEPPIYDDPLATGPLHRDTQGVPKIRTTTTLETRDQVSFARVGVNAEDGAEPDEDQAAIGLYRDPPSPTQLRPQANDVIDARLSVIVQLRAARHDGAIACHRVDLDQGAEPSISDDPLALLVYRDTYRMDQLRPQATNC
jgi:hypothetical protein